MANRLLPLALSVGVVATGCAQMLAGSTSNLSMAGQAASLGSPKSHSGYGTVTVKVTGLPTAGFQTAAMKGVSVGKLILMVCKSDGFTVVKDISGKEAIYYKAIGSSGTVDITIPDLPSTADTTTIPTSAGNPYVFKLRAYTTGPAIGLVSGDSLRVASPSVPPNTELDDLLDIKKDYAKASGETVAHVVAGLPAIVTIDSFAHFGANLANTSGSIVNALTLTGAQTVTEGSTSGIMRVRVTGLQAAKIGTADKKASATVAFSSAAAGDKISVAFSDSADTAEAFSYPDLYTVGSGDDAAAVAGAVAAALTAKTEFAAKYTAAQVGSTSTFKIEAKTAGAAGNISGLGVTSNGSGTSATAAVYDNVVKRVRVLLEFPSAVTSNTLWTVKYASDANKAVDKVATSSAGVAIDRIAGTKLFAGVSPAPSNANTQHWVDVDDDTRGRRFTDGVLDVTVTGIKTYKEIRLLDLVLGEGATSSTTVK